MIRAPALLALAALLAGCESVPDSGDVVTAQVLAQPRSRAELAGGYTGLHAALRAGVARADAERGRLWRAQCVDPDAGTGVRGRAMTLLLPDGVDPAPGALVEVAPLEGTGPQGRHARFIAVLAGPLPAGAPLPPGWRLSFDRPRPLCSPPGAAAGRVHVQLSGAVAAWEIDFAQAELARHSLASDAELAAGRIVVVACQLKVADGSDWTRPSWIARVPGTLAARVGAVVRLRAGAEDGGRHAAPLADVLDLLPGVPPAPGNGVVRCR